MSGEQTKIEFTYKARGWQKRALKELGSHNRSVIVAHRRAGKTELLAIRLLVAAMELEREHPAPLFGYVAPFLNQAKSVVWTRLKYYTRALLAGNMAKVDESEMSIRLWHGGTIRLFGADYPDRLRGLGFDGVVMDEVAQMKGDTWEAVVLPALSDRRGWAVFIGTPKGQNVFFDIYESHVDDKDWYVETFPASKTGLFTAEELESYRLEMGDNLYCQEWECDFTSDNDDSFIDFGRVMKAMERERSGFNDSPVIMGIDIAAQGADRSCIAVRRGDALEGLEPWREANTMRSVEKIGMAIERWKPKAAFMDCVGLGMGPIDRLRELGYRIIGINSGSSPSDTGRFANLKAEMWWKMNEWLLNASIPKDEMLRKDLLSPRRDYDSRNKLMVETKRQLKSRLKFSTDLADAVALTFAQPVSGRTGADQRPAVAEDDWV